MLHAIVYRAFMTNLERLRELSACDASLRDLDRYLWLTGQYRDWRKKREEAQLNSELRSLFEDNRPRVQADLKVLLGQNGPPSTAV